jgi:hypothetical protein
MISYIIFENEFFFDIKPVIFAFRPCVSVRCPNLWDCIEHGGFFVSTERLLKWVVKILGFESEWRHHRVGVVEGTLQEFVGHAVLRQTLVFWMVKFWCISWMRNSNKMSSFDFPFGWCIYFLLPSLIACCSFWTFICFFKTTSFRYVFAHLFKQYKFDLYLILSDFGPIKIKEK